MIEPPFYPIIYLRGYAGSQGEVEDTVSTPYMGFNLGSTRIRQIHTGEMEPHVFESPVIRLMKDHGYVDACRDGRMRPRGPVPGRSIWIFRYYDVVDEDHGDGVRREIEFHARKLGELLRGVRKSVLGSGEDPGRFRAYLVAHSMGGLICRCYLQNPDVPDIDGLVGEAKKQSAKGIDKLFTYGTPHGGIEFRRGLGWMEGLRDFFDPNNAGNFGPARMREFLGLEKAAPVAEDSVDGDKTPPAERTPSAGKIPLNSLNGWFPEERVFCLVGTDARDYGAAGGLSKRAVGPLSDGLVRIRNATVLGAPRAFVHRSHSGHYGLVNSESGYQNLRRFLFGEWRVRVELSDVSVSLPREVERKKAGGARVLASYHIDTIVSVRGVPVELNRRTCDEGSAIFRAWRELTEKPTTLFTAFVMGSARINPRRRSLGLALRLQVRVPEYEVDGRLFDQHYEGGMLFADKLNLEVTPRADGGSRVRYGWDGRTPNRASRPLRLVGEGEALTGAIPVTSGRSRPGISGNIRLTVTRWNVPPSQ